MTGIPILFEDGDVIVAVKPAGMLSSPAPGVAEDLQSALARGGEPPVCVTRLDRAVGGAAVLAKNAKAMAALSALVQDHGAFVKEYLAVVAGQPEDEGVLEDLLYHDPAKNKTFAVDKERRGVKSARLCYRVLARTEQGALLRVRLYTGRTHQIRAQFSSRGFPLFGDGKYGSRVHGCQTALYSFRVSFPHGGRVLDRCAPLPSGFPWDLFPEEVYAALPSSPPLPAENR